LHILGPHLAFLCSRSAQPRTSVALVGRSPLFALDHVVAHLVRDNLSSLFAERWFRAPF
jgi:hypothetical protein